jgi:hypothetical protein
MMKPYRERLSKLADDEVLKALEEFEPLPDENDPGWNTEPYPLFDQAAEFLALADEVAERRLTSGIIMLLDRACYGDPGETMRILRHPLEATVAPDWDALVAICIPAARSPRPGTRIWATAELGVLRSPASVEVLMDLLNDPVEWVRGEAVGAVFALSQDHPTEAATFAGQIRRLSESDPSTEVQRQAAQVLDDLQAS